MYKNFKTVFCTERYVQAFYIGRKAKSAFSMFRCGIAPINRSKFTSGRTAVPLLPRVYRR